MSRTHGLKWQAESNWTQANAALGRNGMGSRSGAPCGKCKRGELA